VAEILAGRMAGALALHPLALGNWTRGVALTLGVARGLFAFTQKRDAAIGLSGIAFALATAGIPAATGVPLGSCLSALAAFLAAAFPILAAVVMMVQGMDQRSQLLTVDSLVGPATHKLSDPTERAATGLTATAVAAVVPIVPIRLNGDPAVPVTLDSAGSVIIVVVWVVIVGCLLAIARLLVARLGIACLIVTALRVACLLVAPLSIACLLVASLLGMLARLGVMVLVSEFSPWPMMAVLLAMVPRLGLVAGPLVAEILAGRMAGALALMPSPDLAHA
jgi:hypothetical protein